MLRASPKTSQLLRLQFGNVWATSGVSSAQQSFIRHALLGEGNDLNIRRATETDAERIAEIYNWYVLHTIITFETTVVTSSDMKRRIQETLATHDWLVGESNQQVVGYAYYGPFRTRAAYSHTVESTVYLSQEATGKGFGKSLYSALIESATRKGFREMIGVIALPNPASIALHRTLGFHEVGTLRGVGHKCGQYVDVGLWQRSSRT